MCSAAVGWTPLQTLSWLLADGAAEVSRVLADLPPVGLSTGIGGEVSPVWIHLLLLATLSIWPRVVWCSVIRYVHIRDHHVFSENRPFLTGSRAATQSWITCLALQSALFLAVLTGL